MAFELEVLFTPAEFGALCRRDLTATVCVVFDVLRATSTIVTALANGAAAVIPVEEIPEALTLRRKQPDILLAGERNGLRIGAVLTGGIEFDLGNSPREFTSEKVRGKTIVATTTNGTRALRACAAARSVLVCSFLNLRATAQRLEELHPTNLLLVCSGTREEAAWEDVLCAGALLDSLAQFDAAKMADSVHVARSMYRGWKDDLPGAMQHSSNARRLLALPELRDDVAFCLQRDLFDLVATADTTSVIKKSDAR
jgi:2-phosphosulfolactate phosphatase